MVQATPLQTAPISLSAESVSIHVDLLSHAASAWLAQHESSSQAPRGPLRILARTVHALLTQDTDVQFEFTRIYPIGSLQGPSASGDVPKRRAVPRHAVSTGETVKNRSQTKVPCARGCPRQGGHECLRFSHRFVVEPRRTGLIIPSHPACKSTKRQSPPGAQQKPAAIRELRRVRNGEFSCELGGQFSNRENRRENRTASKEHRSFCGTERSLVPVR